MNGNSDDRTPEDGRLYVTEGGAITRTVADILSSPSRAKAAATMADLRSSKTRVCKWPFDHTVSGWPIRETVSGFHVATFRVEQDADAYVSMRNAVETPPAPASNERLTPEKLAEYREIVPLGIACGVGGGALAALLDEIERLKRARDEAREHTSTAAFMRLEAERDEWARKWHRVRAELAELKYPGMKGIVRPLSGEPASGHETSDGWQPIETAPKDGRTLLLGYFNKLGNWRSLHGQWFEQAEMDEWTSDDEGNPAGWYEISVENDDPPNCWATEPTHWQPTPRPPEKADELRELHDRRAAEKGWPTSENG